MRRTIGMGAALAVLVVLAPVAWADDKAAAEDLFLEGRKLLKAGKTAEACDAFQRSHELDAQFGTLFNLANCLRDLGKTATAWGMYRELAQRDSNAERRKKSADAAKALEPKLTKMLITIEANIPGLVVLRDGDDVTPTVGRETKVDPGEHRIVARADGYKEWIAEVKASGEGATVTVTIPPLEKLPPIEVTPPDDVAAPPDDEPDPDDVIATPRGSRPTWPLFVAGGGGVALAGGVALGLVARGKWSDATAICGEDRQCADQADADRANALADDAALFANLSTAAVGVGVVALGVGLVLYLTGGDDGGGEHALRITPTVTPDTAMVTIGGWL